MQRNYEKLGTNHKKTYLILPDSFFSLKIVVKIASPNNSLKIDINSNELLENIWKDMFFDIKYNMDKIKVFE